MLKTKNVKGLRIIISLMMAVAIFISLGKFNVVYAASATVTISSATVTQGQEVKVNVEISADANIGAYNFYLEYDASVLEAVSGFEGGGGGRIQVLYDVPDEASLSKKITKTIKFKAIAPGNTDIKYACLNADDGVIDYDTIDNMSVTSKNGTVKVNPPVIASKNNNLASMTVAAVRADGSSYNVPLSPAFSKDVTKYNISVEEGVTDLVVAAKTEDAKAKIYVQWANLDPGDNTTKIIVTAEDGSKKEYVIYTKVPVPETTTPEPVDPIVTVIDGTEYFVENVNDAVVLPEGFEAVDYDYNGKTVVVGKGVAKDLIVMYLTNGTGEAGSLFIYDEASKSFYPMVNVAMSQKLYTIVKAPTDLVIPDGFKDSVVTIDGVEFNGWQSAEIEGVYLVYAMNWNGKSGLYFYDTDEQQMIKYFDVSVEAGVGLDDYNSLVAENESLKADISKLENTEDKNDTAKEQMYKYIIYIAIAVIVILIGAIIVLALKKKKDDIEEEDNNSDALDSVFADIESKEAAEQAEKTELSVLPEETEISEEEEVSEASVEVTEECENAEENSVEETEESENNETTDLEKETIENDVETISEDIRTIVSLDETMNSDKESLYVEETSDKEETSEDLSLEAELGSFVSAIFDEEAEEKDTVEVKIEETSEEIEEENTEEENTVEENTVEETVEETEEETLEETVKGIEEKVQEETTEKTTEETSEEIKEPSIPEETENKSVQKAENKKKVAKILQDENTSIKEEELDMVIDELFDDLFGE